MKYELPDNHGLSDQIVEKLVFHEEGKPALTDAQQASLEAGIGRGESLLVVSPTSTGKTQIALWAIAKSIELSCTTVYLVTHRALAKQKFEEFKRVLLDDFFGNSHSAIILATGDYIEDAEGNIPADPLAAPLMVATYEKYLAMLSASGIPNDMTSSVIVCDEIQLIGDANRGQNVEVLMTLLRNAGWKQFVGLSAVLHNRDANDLANWLDVKLVFQHTREKHLLYECWGPREIVAVSSEQPDILRNDIPLPQGINPEPLLVLLNLLRLKKPPLPIIVFCVKNKRETYDLAEQLLKQLGEPKPEQLSLAFEELPETSANALLSKVLARRVAIHNADLTEDERHIIEEHLLERKVDIVFATPTLAAGVNFPFGAAIFASWKRWNEAGRRYIPIETSEFHNMAGRVGRMGFEHAHGRVIFTATDVIETRAAAEYLKLGSLPELEPRIDPSRFRQLALQLVTSGLCKSREELINLVCETFSGLREQDRNLVAFQAWPERLNAAVDYLKEQTLLLEAGNHNLVATPIGREISHSGLLPETGVFLISYAINKADHLTQLLPTKSTAGDLNQLYFLICCACASSPEFRPSSGCQPTRYFPWPLRDAYLFDADPFRNNLPDPVWQADVVPVNAAKLSIDWIEGAELRNLEASLPQLSAGMLREMYRNIVWVLQGFASILTVASDTRVPSASRPTILNDHPNQLITLRKLPRIIRRLSFRIAEGLPEDVLWMISLNYASSEFKIARNEILLLRQENYTSPEKVMLGTAEADKTRLKAFASNRIDPQKKSNWLRDECRNWKAEQRKRTSEKHIGRAKKYGREKLFEEFYLKRGTEFENSFECILNALGIDFQRLDDKTKTGAPDYLINLNGSPPLVIELKSRDGDKLIDYNRAVEVLAASEIHGFKDAFCVTLCHPGVDPSVPLVITECGRLSVVESSDLGEALLRLCEGTMTQSQLYAWLASPGQALWADLPFREYF